MTPETPRTYLTLRCNQACWYCSNGTDIRWGKAVDKQQVDVTNCAVDPENLVNDAVCRHVLAKVPLEGDAVFH